jgi:hypothetical protein
MADGTNTLKLIARDERRRQRAEERQREKEERKTRLKMTSRQRADAYDDRRQRTITPHKRRKEIVGVVWREGGISKLHRYGTRFMILKYMKEHYAAGEVIDRKKLELEVADFLYGDSIVPFLRKLEEGAHIDYVYKT